MISFDNTEIAFSGKTDSDLQWSYRLFKMIGKPWLVKSGAIATRFALAIHLPVKGAVKKTIFKQFCGGESIAECESKIQDLSRFQIGTILDYSVEGKTSDEALDHARDEIIATIRKAKGDSRIPFSVFKVTGLARTELLEKWNPENATLNETEQKELEAVKARVDAICQAAYDANVPVFIDAEDSWYQDGIDRLANAMMRKYNTQTVIVYNTLQMYRHDRLEFLKKTHRETTEGNYLAGIKLVRGAYMEKERERAAEKGYRDPIQPDKASTDRDYDAALEYMAKNLDRFAICAGTHNEKSSAFLVELMQKLNISKNDKRIFFAQLLGMSDHISFNLAHAGYNVAKYVPYGPVREVLPYLIRRAQENTSVAGQMGRELSLIVKEKSRRKSISKN